tara:strand:- start:1671 stop:1961 length:291 start_codon:yes stop_codon:yes gene_type:complete
MKEDVKVEDIAQDVNKITDEELKSIQEIVDRMNKVQMQIGALQVQQQGALEQFRVDQVGLQELQKELEEKYGRVSVNLTDGTISEIPEEDEANKEN